MLAVARWDWRRSCRRLRNDLDTSDEGDDVMHGHGKLECDEEVADDVERQAVEIGDDHKEGREDQQLEKVCSQQT